MRLLRCIFYSFYFSNNKLLSFLSEFRFKPNNSHRSCFCCCLQPTTLLAASGHLQLWSLSCRILILLLDHHHRLQVPLILPGLFLFLLHIICTTKHLFVCSANRFCAYLWPIVTNFVSTTRTTVCCHTTTATWIWTEDRLSAAAAW